MQRKKLPNPIDAHVGSRVRLRRAMLNVSQEKLGEHLGITFQQIQKYEKGTNRISASALYRIADVLSVPVSFFFAEMPGDNTTPAPTNTFERLDFDIAIAARGLNQEAKRSVLSIINTLHEAASKAA